MNRNLLTKRAIALITAITFLLVISALTYATLTLFSTQQGITRSLMSLDEIRYAEEFGLRHGLWVWRYKYSDPLFLNNGTQPYEVTLAVNSYNVESVWVRVEDKNSDYKLDDDEIETQVNKVSWSL